jgi:hypothetical protein
MLLRLNFTELFREVFICENKYLFPFVASPVFLKNSTLFRNCECIWYKKKYFKLKSTEAIEVIRVLVRQEIIT